MASHGSRSLAEAGPSVPRATGTPAASRSGMRANPLPSFWFDAGQWATAAPLAATSSRSSVVRWTPWASTVPGPSSRCRAAPRSACGRDAARTAASSAAVSQAWTWTRAPSVGGELTDGPRAALVEQVRAVRADPAACRAASRRAGRRAHVERASSNRRRSAPANSTNTGPARRSKPASAATAVAASGKKYMSSAVVMPARRHSATASAVPAATVVGGQHGALGRQQAGEETVEVEVVGEARGTSSWPGGCGR